MLKNIKLHLDSDEDRQLLLDGELARHIAKTHKKNVYAFAQSMPSMMNVVTTEDKGYVSVFSNKQGDINLVDLGTGRTLYGLEPVKEVARHLELFCHHPLYVDFSASEPHPLCENSDSEQPQTLTELPVYQQKASAVPLPDGFDVMVVLGVGIGWHIETLLNDYDIKHLVIYEPEEAYFKNSVTLCDWSHIFTLANQKGTGIYIQYGMDGRNLIEDMEELRQAVEVDGFYLYRHYNHPVFRSVESGLRQYCWSQLKKNGLPVNTEEKANEYLPAWSLPADILSYQSVTPENTLYQSNMAAFKAYFPDIYQEFKDYQPGSWLPVVERNNEQAVNIAKRDDLTTWYGQEAKEECRASYRGFCEAPAKDGVVLGYAGTKLKHYRHYQLVQETEELLKAEESKLRLPEEVKSLIMFGLGAGYQLETLCENHTIGNLFICEPNRDFFYSSLFAIDWHAILTKIDKDGGRLYLNIGDDGSNLFRDLLNRFYSIGPYILANTFFYQTYYNSLLNSAVAQLREQLQTVIAMGEYFDHAYYGINQTHSVIKSQQSFLKGKPAGYLSQQSKDVPVFLIGNGPSLDDAIEFIKEWQDKAILISCGTSLQSLNRYGITPDFHSEIEQNRSSFDWAASVADYDYLKQIDLLSCNGIHPDTVELYRNSYLAFKDGESSTTSTLEVLNRSEFESLKFAFPTVSNFSLNLILSLGFDQVYLFGVDLGFKEQKKHHSSASGYYDGDGEEYYDYADKNNTSIMVEGNFSSRVFTKYEFKVAKVMLEQSLAQHKVDCYNTSDGAKISGTNALQAENILITTTSQDKEQALKEVKTQAFAPIDYADFRRKLDNKYSDETLKHELGVFRSYIQKPFTSIAEIEFLIEQQKVLLFASYKHGKSLLFYYLYGTVNFINALFTRLLNIAGGEEKVLEVCEEARQHWSSTFDDMLFAITTDKGAFDCTHSLADRGFKDYARHKIKNCNVKLLTDSNDFASVMQRICESEFEGLSVDVGFGQEVIPAASEVCDSPVLIYIRSAQFDWQTLLQRYQFNQGALIITQDINNEELVSAAKGKACVLFSPGNVFTGAGFIQSQHHARVWVILDYLHQLQAFDYVFHKYELKEDASVPLEEAFVERFINSDSFVFDNVRTVGVANRFLRSSERILNLGVRARITRHYRYPDFLTKGILTDAKWQAWKKMFLTYNEQTDE
ncbi:MAG: 6-hydroxymethylpterin diphosphokinase MptE-like protein [Pseudomonadota bacterium]|uniref:6-hydroxymethylpterin diphosphokinase MptE-like protein n=1 Tax=Alteromonas oceani TaxID=2071609 RepID=A0ABV7JW09_9ALTE|nr:6-hydroxymethylpterin diphosphokinase MptE-like protein [Alteromonas oceani]MEC9260641.1 6-hydroxymethylpterin diphosphokinase MptE-like protein [Pseudomonadota bacterium]